MRGTRQSASRAALVDYALQTARELCARAPRAGARPDGRANLMAGAAGVAAFLAEVHRALGERWALDGARRWLGEARARSRAVDAYGGAGLAGWADGLISGKGSLAWAALAIADAAGDRAARGRALVALVDAAPGALDCTDLLRGRAAYAEAAADLASWGGWTATQRAALVRLRRDGEASALTHARAPLTAAPLAVAHGLAGMLLVLLRSPDPAHVDVALARVDELGALRARGPGGLATYPLREGVAPGALLGTWCNGTTGFLQLFLRATAVAPTARRRARLFDAASTVARIPATSVPILCCGSAGRALFLEDAAAATGEAGLRRRAQALLASAMTRARGLDHALFSGRTGVAWVALALSAPGARRPLPFAAVTRGS